MIAKDTEFPQAQEFPNLIPRVLAPIQPLREFHDHVRAIDLVDFAEQTFRL
jgi:hypothetical protein